MQMYMHPSVIKKDICGLWVFSEFLTDADFYFDDSK